MIFITWMIRLYANKEWDIGSLIHLTWSYSEDIGMSFSLEKCGHMVVKRGENSNDFGCAYQAYKPAISTLVSHSHLATMKKPRKSATSKYHQRVKEILKSQPSEKNCGSSAVSCWCGKMGKGRNIADVNIRELFIVQENFHFPSPISKDCTPAWKKVSGLGNIGGISDRWQLLKECLNY